MSTDKKKGIQDQVVIFHWSVDCFKV